MARERGVSDGGRGRLEAYNQSNADGEIDRDGVIGWDGKEMEVVIRQNAEESVEEMQGDTYPHLH